jgi:hypothetical protein
MARCFGDGYDPYASASDVALRYASAATNTIVAAVNTAFGIGQAVGVANSATALSAVWEAATNETTIYGSLRLKYNSGSSASGNIFSLTLQDGANNQVTLQWLGDGSLQVRSGGTAGTSLGTQASAFSLNTWDSWQFKAVINNTTGSVEIRKNGSATATLNITGANTRAGSTNNYATKFTIGANTGLFQLDDLWFSSDNGAAPTSWPGDVRAKTLQVASQTQAQLSTIPSNYSVVASAVTTSNFSASANVVRFFAVTMAGTGVLASLTANFQASMTGHAKMALYDATGAGTGPGALLATSAEITNPGAGVNTFTVASGPTLTNGTKYWVAIMQDAAATFLGSSTTGGDTLAQTYGSGFPSSAAGFAVVSTNYINAGLNATPLNWYQVSDVTEDGDTSYVYSSTVGQEDIYGVTALGLTPASILGVNVFAFWKKSDSGGRGGTISVAANGSADTAEVSNVTPSLSYTYSQKFLATDPTGAVWTAANINAMTIGVAVAS